MDKDGSGTVTYDEFVKFYHLIPAESLKLNFKRWAKTSSIDIGESVVVNDEAEPGTSVVTTLVAGGVAGAISRSLTAPLDRLKVILQV